MTKRKDQKPPLEKKMDQKDFAESLGSLSARWKKITSGMNVKKVQSEPLVKKSMEKNSVLGDGQPGLKKEESFDVSSKNLNVEAPSVLTDEPLLLQEQEIQGLSPVVLVSEEMIENKNIEELKQEVEQEVEIHSSLKDLQTAPSVEIKTPSAKKPNPIHDALSALLILPEASSMLEPVIEEEFDWDLWSVVMEEVDEYMPQIRQEFSRLGQEDLSVLPSLYRLLHTMKGVVGQFGALRARGLFHALESMMEEFQSNPSVEMVASRFADMQIILDSASSLVDGLRDKQNLPMPFMSEGALQWLPSALQQTILAEQKNLALQKSNLSEEEERGESSSSEESIDKEALPVLPESIRRESLSSEDSDQMVRVKASSVDYMLTQSNEMRLARSGLRNGLEEVVSLMKDLDENGQRLAHMLREIEIHADSQIQSRRLEMEAGSDTFDPLEFDRFTRLQELARFMAEGLNDVNQIQQALQRVASEQETRLSQQDHALEEVQEGLAQTRLTSVGKVVGHRLESVIRQTSRELGKNVDFEIQGSRIEVDRVLITELFIPLSHILRNALSHGIESPEVRKAKGKPKTGQISLQFRLEGGRLKVVCQDDGAGLNLKIIKQKAIERGLWDASLPMTLQQAADMICQPRFSTAESVSELSGRGVGMDVVRNSVLELGGRFTIESEEGHGMTVTMLIPTSLSMVMSLVVTASEQRWSFPAESVAQVQVLRGEELEKARKERLWVDASGQEWRYDPLVERLGLKEGFEQNRKNAFVVALREKDQRIAVEVDRIRSVQDLPLRPLGRAWARMPGLLGATLMPDGEAIFLLDMLRLPSILVDSPLLTRHERHQLTILVVDDSLTVRRHCERILINNGYRAILVKDGREALDFLTQEGESIDGVVLDVEMPRMDGFELTRQIRSDPHLRHLPLIMVTSRTAEKHRNHAVALGVNDYLGKPVKDEELLMALKKWVTV